MALELWSISNDVIFDNFLITSDKAVADKLAEQSWKVKSAQESSSGTVRPVFAPLSHARVCT